MSKIILKKMTLINFKGIKNLSIDFNENTNIFGANGTGKTSVFDAFTWLMFGKDSTDRKDFEIKTLDAFNMAIPKIEHEVSALVLVDGEEVSIKRILKEKWVKQRGALESEFTGNETLYYWNEVPLSQKEFQNKVSQILDESIFKLITSPTAFNALKWQDRRNVLIQIAGEVSDDELAAGNSDYEKLVSQLSNKSLDEYKKQIAATIKKAKDDIKTIPTRIDEVERSKTEPVDEENLNAEILAKEKLIESLDNQLQDKAAAYDEVIRKRNANQEKIFELKSKINAFEFNAKEKAKNEHRAENSKAVQLQNEIAEATAELKSAEAKRDTLADKRDTINLQIAKLEMLMADARTLWSEVNSRELVFSDLEFCCPTCKRDFEASDVEAKKAEMKENFIADKQNQLANISANGKAHASEKANLETELETLEERIAKGTEFIINLDKKINGLRADLLIENNQSKSVLNLDEVVDTMLATNIEYLELKREVAQLEALKFDLPENQNQQLKDEKAKINDEIAELRLLLNANVQIKNADKRINELMEEECKLAQQIADIEKEQYTIDNFIKLQTETIESRVNEKFSFVKFKLFETQINGAEVPTCEALINGVPFSDANTASKINAGVDIINTLCEFYKVSAPIFIDNRESVVDLIDSESQIINLIVSAGDRKLRVA
ncbi:AAA family ATPase [Chryseobacterium sp. R2A-55]|uniref:AAA family ATPase n=1 Tax=Chryseobacterium sp. R2A-55 TaxID=2744445 RepID=UPI001F1E7247|nr:AAA family ATPase [Chryseobacterium sp. R2A-55]